MAQLLQFFNIRENEGAQVFIFIREAAANGQTGCQQFFLLCAILLFSSSHFLALESGGQAKKGNNFALLPLLLLISVE